MVSTILINYIGSAERSWLWKTVESKQHHFRIVWKYTLVQIEQIKNFISTKHSILSFHDCHFTHFISLINITNLHQIVQDIEVLLIIFMKECTERTVWLLHWIKCMCLPHTYRIFYKNKKARPWSRIKVFSLD